MHRSIILRSDELHSLQHLSRNQFRLIQIQLHGLTADSKIVTTELSRGQLRREENTFLARHSKIAMSGAGREGMVGPGTDFRFSGSHFSSHPQTVARKWAIFTRLLRISIIQGCSSIRQGEARREGSFSRLRMGGVSWLLEQAK
jgi:hypothetical protein